MLAKSQLKIKFRQNARLCRDRIGYCLKYNTNYMACRALRILQPQLYLYLVFINERESNDIF